MTDNKGIGRAGFDVEHVAHGKGGNRANRQRLLDEEFRSLDPAQTAKQAARNENIDTARTGSNQLYVNDGQGGFRPAVSVDEVLDYGDAREKRVRRKIDDAAMTTTMIDIHLPKSMCEERTWTTPDGKTRRYWAAKDPAEAARFFDEARALLIKKLPDGQRGIHSEARHFDEYTPHAQWVVDPFGPDPKSKDPERDLRVMWSQTWGSHREVRDEKGVQISGARKMSEWQATTRSHMIEKDFPVEAEVDPVRNKRKHAKRDYVELAEKSERLDKRDEATRKSRVILDAEIKRHNEQVAALASRRADVATAEAAAAEDRQKAVKELADAELTRRDAAEAAKALRDRVAQLEVEVAATPAPQLPELTKADVIGAQPDVWRLYLGQQPKVAESFEQFARARYATYQRQNTNPLGEFQGQSFENFKAARRQSIRKTADVLAARAPKSTAKETRGLGD